MKNICPLLALASLLAISHANAQYADAVVSYNPGTGFSAGYTDPSVVLGEPSRVTPGSWGGPVDPFSAPWQSGQLVSVGAGGSLTVQFNTPIRNDPGNPFGLDFIIFGSSAFMITNGDYSGGGIGDGSLFGNCIGDTRVSVSADNVTYYTLNPSFAPVVDSYFPTDGSGSFQTPVNPALTAVSFAGQNLAGIRSLYGGSAGGTGYDIGWAGVSLPSISYIRLDVLSDKAEIDGFSAVPEPTVFAVAGVALGWFGFAQWRRKLGRA